MTNKLALATVLSIVLPNVAFALDNHAHNHVKDSALGKTSVTLYGPQSPRDIESELGHNPIVFSKAPQRSVLNLCNIHFHKNAEHRGGEFTTPAKAGSSQAGFLFSGQLSEYERKPLEQAICEANNEGLNSGDTIELHYVYTTAPVQPGATLGACLSEHIKNPQLRVEAQVMVLTNDGYGENFNTLTEFAQVNGYYQAVNLPTKTGTPVEYTGSTTGPSYNQKSSPFKVTWSVRPKVLKADINSVGKWCSQNPFNETAAHGVRDLVTAPEHLSPILD
ncbi:hypothetical protein HG263_04935 [Pseudoalteromonas sp. JBTF-M23]|uniref:Cadmium carbonic anhydrase-like repeat protein n=1 Tax=Pseudoalteromonas caenipelagi TaxID=2726988 RepID=A0A849VAT9_9GAMM|nr:delta-class carbonic anhydrase [Pseudoalteromonas caenipelagi]NOU49880.1 hypothetical protein [Pseudoalteromonas caenipelagi]